jgi:hypothetical protein
MTFCSISHPQLPSLPPQTTAKRAPRRSQRPPARLPRLGKAPQAPTESNQANGNKPRIWKVGGKGSRLETIYQRAPAGLRERESIPQQHEIEASVQDRVREWVRRSKETLKVLLVRVHQVKPWVATNLSDDWVTVRRESSKH